MKISVLGVGYVGIPTGLSLALLGHNVTFVDKDQERINLLQSGVSPIYEPGLAELLRDVKAKQNISFTTKICHAVIDQDFVFLAVPTPQSETGHVDTSILRQAIVELANFIIRPINIVIKSTVPAGTAEWVCDLLLQQGVSRELFEIVSCPEFLQEGSAIKNVLNPDRIVIGAIKLETRQAIADLYHGVDTEVLLTDNRTAELIKYASNAFLATKLSFINAMSRIAETSGADIADIARGMGLDPRIGTQYLNASLGWGGSCLPKDVQGLLNIAHGQGYDFKLLREVESVNQEQVNHFIDRIEKSLGGFSGKTVGILGLSFKADTDDIRDSSSLKIIAKAQEAGAILKVYDPVAMENCRKLFPDLIYCQDAKAVSVQADILVIVTDWPEFKTLNLAQLATNMKTPIMLDAHRCFDAKLARENGFTYGAVGVA